MFDYFIITSYFGRRYFASKHYEQLKQTDRAQLVW